MPFISVIIPLFNKENFIKNTLKSVLCQTFTDFEIIIVNDGSTDGSEAKAISFEDSRIRYYTKKNGGVSSARNFGIEQAKSEYITFLDADDYWYPHFLQEIVKAISHHPEQQVFATAFEIETPKKCFPAQYSIKKTADFEIVNFFGASGKETVLWTSSCVFHQSVFEKAGLFDEEIKSGQDTDLWIRIGLIYPVVFCWEIGARYVYAPNSLSKKKESLYGKMSFLKFSELEKNHPDLKKFLDLNRFSLAIKSKLDGNTALFENYYQAIDLEKLSFKKRILLKLPSPVLRSLIELKTILAEYGFGRSVFK